MFRLSLPKSALIHRLFELSPPDAKLPAIGINLEHGFRTKYHDLAENAPMSPGFFNLRTSDNPKPGPVTELEVTVAVQMFYEMIVRSRI